MPFSFNDSSMPDLRKKKFNHRTLTSVYEQQKKNENEPNERKAFGDTEESI